MEPNVYIIIETFGFREKMRMAVIYFLRVTATFFYEYIFFGKKVQWQANYDTHILKKKDNPTLEHQSSSHRR
jgi:hypothetical protein